ncbi:hypothetical protein [Brevibacillus laterosporus]|uniref:hypothetical protein n=1 Tax=Brevibacillus laterosporus TaxID=1465 RepID=UPI00215CC620|nr:hypothetical protein [Brevibacillus laterosporus]MCR8994619.1 hypothetical protein [Brevibacillus laterosporus]
MKKILSLVFALTILFGASSVYACKPVTPIKNVHDLAYKQVLIANVLYENGVYWLVSEKDAEGGEWVLDWSLDTYSKDKLNAYKKMVGLKVEVMYHHTNDELITWYFTGE